MNEIDFQSIIFGGCISPHRRYTRFGADVAALHHVPHIGTSEDLCGSFVYAPLCPFAGVTAGYCIMQANSVTQTEGQEQRKHFAAGVGTWKVERDE